MSAPLAYAAPVAAETVGFGSFPVEPDDFNAKIKFLVAETFSGVGSLVSTHTETVLPMTLGGRTVCQERCGRTFRLAVNMASV